MAGDNKKLLGSVYIKTDELKKNIDAANKLLASLGKGINLDVTKQIEAKLEPIKKKIAEIGVITKSTSTSSASNTKEQVSTITQLNSVTTKYSSNAENAYSKVKKGIDSAGRAVTEYYDSTGKQIKLNATKKFEDQYKKDRLAADEAAKAAEKYGQAIVKKLGTIELKMLKEQWKAAIEYASNYYDAMNEIRVVTGKSEQDAERIGASYRKLAKDMKVTSTELSSAAITFYRQGQNDDEVNKRLEAVTKYAKIANIEFNAAAELITATTNSMNEDVEKVIDVFLMLGDSAATSGEEIGKGMQKAAAAAATFGQDFEWLATYIATVSETLRTAPESIGNAFNTMMARMHSIKQNGFNSEDATTINDVAKALKTVDISLLDQSGSWRELDSIFIEISEKWDTMNDKQKSYIATTMAGTRQQNVFFALMNDMAKGVEGESRAWELYTKAVNSAGIATEKYAIWQESVTASQENMNRALEQLYSNLQPTLIKGWYDGIADVVDILAQGTEAMDGWNIKLPLLISGVGLLTVAQVKAGSAAGLFSGILTAMQAHPIIAATTAFIAIAGIISTIAGEIETATERYGKATDAIEASNERIKNYKSLQDEIAESFKKVSNNTERTSEDVLQYNSLLEKLSGISGTAKKAVNDLKNGMIDQATAAGILNSEIEKLIDKEEELSRYQATIARSNLEKPRALSKQASNQTVYSLDDYEKLFSSWGNGLGMDDFENNLRFFFNATKGINDGIIGEVRAMIAGIRTNLEINLGDGDDWGLIASGVMGALFGSDESYTKIKTEAEEYVNQLINLAITGVYGSIDQTQRNALRQSLWNQIAGEDGVLSFSEADMANAILDNADYSIDFGPRMVELIKDILGDMFYDVRPAIEGLAESADVAQQITEVIEGLIEAGFTNVDIKKVLTGMSIEDWKEMNIDGILSSVVGDSMHGLLSSDDWEVLDTEALQAMYSQLNAGTAAEELKKIFDDSGSLEKFKEALKGISKETEEVNETTETTAAAVGKVDWLKKIKEYQEDISKFDSAIKTLKAGKNLSRSDLLGLADDHPILLAYMDDARKLIQIMENLRNVSENDLKYSLSGFYADTRTALLDFNKLWEKTSQSNHSLVQDYITSNPQATLKDLQNIALPMAYVDGEPGLLNAIYEYLEKISAAAIEATKEVETLEEKVKQSYFFGRADSVIENASKENLGAYMKNVFGLGNVDLLNRKLVPDGEGNTMTVDSRAYTAGTSEEWGKEYSKNVILHMTPILPNGDVLSDDALENYVNELLGSDDILAADKIENGGMGLLLWAQDAGDSFEEALKLSDEYDESLHLIQEEYYLGMSTLDEYALKIQNAFDLGKASANGYQDQISEQQNAFNSGEIDEVIDVFNKLDPQLQSAVKDKFPRLVKAIDDAANAAEGSQKEMIALGKELNSAAFTSGARTFTNTAKAIDQQKNYEINAADAMATFNKEAESAVKAQSEFNTANTNMANGVAVTSDEVQNLATFLGYLNPDVMLDNWDQVGPMLSAALAEGEDAFRRLNEAAFINITGTSEADFSNIQNGIISTMNLTEEMIALLEASGQWKVETEMLDADVWVKEGENWVQKHLTGFQQILKPTGNNPFQRSHSAPSTSKRSSGSGGGGGGSSKKSNSDSPTSSSTSSANQMSEIERMLDVMEQIQKIQDHTKNMYSAMAKYYEGTGELQGVIAYYELEKQALADQNATLEANIRDIEAQMTAKQAEVAGMSTASEAYEQAASDLEKLQSTHQNYTKQLIDNKTEMDSLTKAIKKQQDAIRQMEIDLRDTVYKAIEDREAQIERKLQGRITLENEILDLIQKRYEKERDQIQENSQAQIDALEKERDLLSEQLQLRKEQKEEEDKRAKLASLEEQYQRIVADPTRRKEAINIQKQINDLREEMAWDLAEKEVEAQQKSIDDQITTIEDYMEYIENYYEDLFKYPQKLIAEMESIITQTDDYIMDWLKENSEEYANVTYANQQNMLNNWEQMLQDMHGALKLYWDEVEEIISQGDEAIINFLINNSADYKAAGKLQAQAYVDQWVEQLTNQALAHKQIAAQMIQTNYAIIASATGGGGSGSSSGGSSGSGSSSRGRGSSSGGNQNAGTMQTLYLVTDRTGDVAYFYNKVEAQMERNDRMDQFATIKEVSINSNSIQNGRIGNTRVFAKGGIADFTGPAWLDGTTTAPERILSPVQTELFEKLVASLETMARIRVPSMDAFDGGITSGGTPINVGDIIVNVDKMDTDADYEELAERVFETIMSRQNRGAVVGGIRY